MKEYRPLTKKEIINGNETVVCTLAKPVECMLHSQHYVSIPKPIYEAIIEQLNVFEEIYQQVDEVDQEQKIKPIKSTAEERTLSR